MCGVVLVAWHVLRGFLYCLLFGEMDETQYGDLSRIDGVWAFVEELRLCGGRRDFMMDVILYEVVGGVGEKSLREAGFCLLVPAVDVDEPNCRY